MKRIAMFFLAVSVVFFAVVSLAIAGGSVRSKAAVEAAKDMKYYINLPATLDDPGVALRMVQRESWTCGDDLVEIKFWENIYEFPVYVSQLRQDETGKISLSGPGLYGRTENLTEKLSFDVPGKTVFIRLASQKCNQRFSSEDLLGEDGNWHIVCYVSEEARCDEITSALSGEVVLIIDPYKK